MGETGTQPTSNVHNAYKRKKDKELKIENIQQHHRHHLHETTLCFMESFVHSTEQFEAVTAAKPANKTVDHGKRIFFDIEVIEI